MFIFIASGMNISFMAHFNGNSNYIFKILIFKLNFLKLIFIYIYLYPVPRNVFDVFWE